MTSLRLVDTACRQTDSDLPRTPAGPDLAERLQQETSLTGHHVGHVAVEGSAGHRSLGSATYPYVTRKIGEGKTRRMARRAHKRQLANPMFRVERPQLTPSREASPFAA